MKKIFYALTIIFCLLVFSCKSYNSTFDFDELKLECEQNNITLSTDDFYLTAFPQNAKAGLIFYPGGLVSYEAYLPLMVKFAEQGFACVIVQMPSDFAILNSYAAYRVQMRYSEISRWFLAGHSLGGAMAADYIASHSGDFEGLILLAAYSTKNLSNTNLKVLSVYGSKDEVLNKTNYQKYKSNLPNDFTEFVIEGGNHGHFADYGEQSGDGEATISRTEQQNLTAQKAAELL